MRAQMLLGFICEMLLGIDAAKKIFDSFPIARVFQYYSISSWLILIMNRYGF